MGSVYKVVLGKNSREVGMENGSSGDMEMADLLADQAEDTSDSESDEEEEQSLAKRQLPSGQLPKTRVLMLTSRGVTYRYVIQLSPVKECEKRVRRRDSDRN